MITSGQTFDRTCIRTSDRNHLVTLCQIVSMFVKARCARRKRRQFKSLRQCRQWRERAESYKKTQYPRGESTLGPLPQHLAQRLAGAEWLGAAVAGDLGF